MPLSRRSVALLTSGENAPRRAPPKAMSGEQMARELAGRRDQAARDRRRGAHRANRAARITLPPVTAEEMMELEFQAGLREIDPRYDEL